MFHKLFGSQQPEEDNTGKTMAAIKYTVDETGEISVDVEMEDYSDDSIDALATCLSALSMDESYLQTVQMIQQSLQAENQEEALLRIYTHLASNPNDKAVRVHKEKKKSTPCIKPSDML